MKDYISFEHLEHRFLKTVHAEIRSNQHFLILSFIVKGLT